MNHTVGQPPRQATRYGEVLQPGSKTRDIPITTNQTGLSVTRPKIYLAGLAFPGGAGCPFVRAMPPQNSEQARWFATELEPHEAALRIYLLGKFPTLPDVDYVVQDSLVRVLRAHERGPVESAR